MSKEFNRSEYVRTAKSAGVYHNNSVCAVVVDGVVKYNRKQVRLAIYQHLGYEIPESYAGIEPAELEFAEKTETKTESKKSAPAQNDRIATLESRMDSIESKLEEILAKLG